MSGLSRKHIQQGCEASLRRLGVETIDLYQIHRFDPHTPLDEMLAALDQLVRQGKVRYLGASSMSAWRFAQALSHSERHGWARFATMQNHYNLIYREEEREMIPLCRDEQIGVMPWSPLARGLLAGTRQMPMTAKAPLGPRRTLCSQALRSSVRLGRGRGPASGCRAARHAAGTGGLGLAIGADRRDDADRRGDQDRTFEIGHCSRWKCSCRRPRSPN